MTSFVLLSSAESIEIKLTKQISSNPDLVAVQTKLRCGPGVLFTVYLSQIEDDQSRVTAILGSYAVPADFPKSGFGFSTMVEAGSFHLKDGTRVFGSQYKSGIDSSEELTVDSIVTSSSEQTASTAKIHAFSFLQTLTGDVFPSVSSVKLAVWEIEEAGHGPYLVELRAAYAKNMTEKEFLESVYHDTKWVMDGPMQTYPIQFYQSKKKPASAK